MEYGDAQREHQEVSGEHAQQGSVRLWLDDIRPTPEGWVGVATVEEAIGVLETGRVIEASLDYDLGFGQRYGYALCRWMAEENVWPSALTVHSSNPPGARLMSRLIDEQGPYRRVSGTRRFVK